MDLLAFVNRNRGPFTELTGLEFTEVSLERLVATLAIEPKHHQPYGIVHGGVHATVVETMCSIGAAMHVAPQGRSAVGMENHTSFVRPAREGVLTATAVPVHTGRTTHVWRCDIRDAADQLVATGTMRLAVLEPGARAAGREVSLTG